MNVVTKTISFSTRGNTDIIDITDRVNEALIESKLKEGLATISVIGSTGGLATCEYEPGLISDLKRVIEELIPKNKSYAHDRGWGGGNAHSHLRASLFGPSLTFPFVNGELLLGTWQQIIFIDFDTRARQRKVILQFLGV